MKTITSGEAQKNFGAVVDYATTRESIRVTRYGRPGVYVIAENEASNEMVRKLAGRRMIARLKSMQTSEAAKKLTYAFAQPGSCSRRDERRHHLTRKTPQA